MRFLACIVMVALLGVGLPGCALFKKKDDNKSTVPPPGGGAAPARFPTKNDPLLNGDVTSQAKSGAILAGRVIDNYSRPPANTSIRLVSMDAKDTNGTDVSVTPEGYFTVQGLRPGSNYKLIARGKNGDRLLAGITYTTAPNIRVLIQVKEDFATPGTPDPPGPPAFQDKKAKVGDSPNAFSGNSGLPTLGSVGARPGSDYELPPVKVPFPGQDPPPLPKQDWTAGPNVADNKGTFWPPPLDIANPTAKPAVPPLSIPQKTPEFAKDRADAPSPFAPNPFAPNVFGPNAGQGTPPSYGSDGPARVPSCVLVGKQLVNFALNDVSGEPWEFQRQRRGKLVLIDFWGTTCVHCREAMPALRNLQMQYGGKGLEVIGIAVESGGSFQEQGYRVNAMAQKLQLNYRQLVSTSPACPVRTQFRIEYVPTMVLVDESGWIVWRHQGKPDRATLDELERLIQRKLGVR